MEDRAVLWGGETMSEEGQVADVLRLLATPRAEEPRFEEIKGESPAFARVREDLHCAAGVDYPVLLQGETGTGKDLVASLLHRHGPSPEGPFICVNCAALPETLVESELFGHRRGSFTGADRDSPGLFEAARGGTLFLDEVHQLTPAAQAKLLRAVDTGEYLAVGASRPQRTDARIIAATNEDLEARVARGEFRADLYWRLHVLSVRLPALREVPGDIPGIAAHYAGLIAKRLGRRGVALAPCAVGALIAAPWPGNVRQLIHELERAMLRCEDGELRAEHLSPRLCRLPPTGGRLLEDKERIAQAWEREQILRGLERTGWNASRLAREMGMSRRGLTGKLARYGIRRPDGRARLSD
jgi:DNA-binding NtrC family response regulator